MAGTGRRRMLGAILVGAVLGIAGLGPPVAARADSGAQCDRRAAGSDCYQQAPCRDPQPRRCRDCYYEQHRPCRDCYYEQDRPCRDCYDRCEDCYGDDRDRDDDDGYADDGAKKDGKDERKSDDGKKNDDQKPDDKKPDDKQKDDKQKDGKNNRDGSRLGRLVRDIFD